MEQEATDDLGRERYERSADKKGLRNGYKERQLKSAEGLIPIFLPQIRDTEQTYSSKLCSFVKGNSDVFRYLVAEMYARGLSTRDIEATFTDEKGNCLISKSAVNEVTETLKVIPCFFNEKSALKLAYATQWRASQRWRKVKFSEIEQKHVRELRKKLGLTVETQVNSNEDQKKMAVPLDPEPAFYRQNWT